MNETLKTSASLRGVSNANDVARLSRLAMTQGVGFTMAEILLSLTIIGVVAAITLPSLMANINERTWNTQRKALYARMSQAIAMMPNLNGYGEYEGSNTDGSVTTTKDTAAEAFLTEGLSKVLKINNICDAEHLADCGVPATLTTMAGSIISVFPRKLSELNDMFTSVYIDTIGEEFKNPLNNVDTKTAAFETQNGETIALFYNPSCISEPANPYTDKTESGQLIFSQAIMCANFVYDLNGNRGPNTVGKDIGFITAFYPSDSNVVAPVPLASNSSGNSLSVQQANISSYCLANDGSRVPNRMELASMFVNKKLLDMPDGRMWSGSVYSTELAWYIDFSVGDMYPRYRWGRGDVRCVKR